jgi:hypothetical protein
VVEWVVVIGEPGPQEQQVVLGAPNQVSKNFQT